MASDRAGRRRSRDEDRGGDRRRQPAEAGTGLRHPGQLHPRFVRAAPALVPDRPDTRHGRCVQHVRRGVTLIPPVSGEELERPMPGIDESRDFIPLKIAVLTVSDTRSLAEDKSGATLAERIGKAGHTVADRGLVPDNVEAIRVRVQAWIDDPAIDVVITTGGTGFTGRDVTPEAIEPLFEKRMDGFSTLFLMVSHAKIGTSAIQTDRKSTRL